ncbi:MAG: LysR family transcriptional regulator [Pirellulaceae bacterium]|nr:LysR family transcriptional regulator [Pirellulaceae bacterium]
MNPINFQHLYYFWMVAKHGGISPACRELHLTQPTVSAQLKTLEASLGVPLFQRDGKKLNLTPQGRVALDYANQIFGLGQELSQAIQGHRANPTMDLTVGVTDVLPKHLVYQFLIPAITGEFNVRLRCYEGKLGALLLDLANHRLDVVLSDSPIYQDISTELHSHVLGDCGLAAMGTPRLLAGASGTTLPAKVQSLPVLLPTANTGLRRLLDRWFDQYGLSVKVAGEFEDSGLLKVFAQQGFGLCFVPEVLAEFLTQTHGLQLLGRLDSGRTKFYALTAERMFQHPAVTRLKQAAHERLAVS